MEILGIDVGGSGIKGAIVNTKTGELITPKHRIPTPKNATPDEVADIVNQLRLHFNWKGKVGCGFPTVVHHGVAQYCGNLDKSWIGVDIQKLFNEKTGLNHTVINDADAAAIATMHIGNGKGKMGMVIMITIGTGIGSGVFYNGHLIPSIELGSFPYKKYDKIENWTADSARKREDLSMKQWAKRFNKYLKMVEVMMSPDLIILGGGISKKFDNFKKDITVKTPVIASSYQNNAGIIGAALGAIEESIH